MRKMYSTVCAALIALSLGVKAKAAAEIEGWGDFRGIRLDGQLMPFTTSLRAVSADGRQTAFTATEMVKNPRWSREGAVQTSTGTILFENGKTLSLRTKVEDLTPDTARVDVQATADVDLDLTGIYYHINLPASDFIGGTATVSDTPPVPLPASTPDNSNFLSQQGKIIHLAGTHRTLEVSSDTSLDFIVKRDHVIDTDIVTQSGLRLPRDSAADQLVAIVFPLGTGNLTKGQSVQVTFTIHAGGQIDHQPVTLHLDTNTPGSPFEGIGGNFRVYGQEDLASVDYNLANLRVPWGRVPMLLSAWQPREEIDPVKSLSAGAKLSNTLRQSIEVAKTLSDKGIPLIITTWDMPGWSLLPAGPGTPGRPFVIPARRLRQDKAAEVYDDIVSYLQYLKSAYKVEPRLMSINESDLGIDILQTPEEHAEFIREVGRRMADAGLKTRMLLGDACSPHPVKFVDAAMRDPYTIKYIGAVSFHSWHDGTDAEFRAWGNAARKLSVPLIVGEGGTDSDSYRYPPIFQEPWYAMYELDTYMRICAQAQPLSILHWQMTSNYSLLVGGGRSGQPLAPGRRFWQVKQLNLTPADSAAIPVSGSANNITACAYLDHQRTLIHLLNNAAERTTTITGLPVQSVQAHIYLTDETNGMKELPPATVTNGTITVTLPQDSLVTIDAAP
jgi:hypothetical protein